MTAQDILKNEKLWQEMIHFINYAPTRTTAICMMQVWLTENGYRCSQATIREAMKGCKKGQK